MCGAVRYQAGNADKGGDAMRNSFRAKIRSGNVADIQKSRAFDKDYVVALKELDTMFPGDNGQKMPNCQRCKNNISGSVAGNAAAYWPQSCMIYGDRGNLKRRCSFFEKR
jgi:hypothetical protein